MALGVVMSTPSCQAPSKGGPGQLTTLRHRQGLGDLSELAARGKVLGDVPGCDDVSRAHRSHGGSIDLSSRDRRTRMGPDGENEAHLVASEDPTRLHCHGQPAEAEIELTAAAEQTAIAIKVRVPGWGTISSGTLASKPTYWRGGSAWRSSIADDQTTRLLQRMMEAVPTGGPRSSPSYGSRSVEGELPLSSQSATSAFSHSGGSLDSRRLRRLWTWAFAPSPVSDAVRRWPAPPSA